jgi:hypothetical protein
MSILDDIMQTRKLFDVTSEQDLQLFKVFCIKNAWGKNGCPFILEEPFLSIPEMIRYKISNEFLGIDDI